jgi:hypothetical protein
MQKGLKMRRTIALFFIMGVLLCGCQATPDTNTVVSKNDGNFEAALENTAESQESSDERFLGTESIYTDNFTSTDGSIAFSINLKKPESNAPLSVLQVTPHSFTSVEAEHVARVLFGDADMYEYSKEMSKTAIEKIILELRQHISDRSALVEYYGGDELLADYVTADYENRIAAYEQLYQDAAETVQIQLTDWSFHPQSYYDDSAENNDEIEGYDQTECIEATCTLEGFPYRFNVYNRDAKDYRKHYIHAYVDDETLELNEIYSTDNPTNEDRDSYVIRAQEILETLDFGQWVIVSCVTQEWPDTLTGETLYKTVMDAYPVYNALQLTKVPDIDLVGNSDDFYAENYDYESIRFEFSGDKLTSFEYLGSLEVVSTSKDNVEIISFDVAMDNLKKYLSLMSDASFLYEVDRISIEHMEMGYSRVRIKNNASDFYLIPSYTFYETVPVSYYDENGRLIEEDYEITLAVISAVDGSIINTQLGY